LAKADPSLQILIIDSGKDNRYDPVIATPAFFLKSFTPDYDKLDFYFSKASEHTAGNPMVVPVGNVLGGGTSVNVMQYNRAAASDYDDWNTEGWKFEDLKPLFKKVCK
jgi:alcohol oxidase